MKKVIINQPFVKQILDEMFANIERKEQFDSLTIQKLKHLAPKGDFTDVSKVTEAISPNPEENDENS